MKEFKKNLLRYLYRRQYGYFPFLFFSYFFSDRMVCKIWYGNFPFPQMSKRFDITHFHLLLYGQISCPILLSQISFLVPDKYIRAREHKLFAVPQSRTDLYRGTPLCRSMDLVWTVYLWEYLNVMYSKWVRACSGLLNFYISIKSVYRCFFVQSNYWIMLINCFIVVKHWVSVIYRCIIIKLIN